MATPSEEAWLARGEGLGFGFRELYGSQSLNLFTHEFCKLPRGTSFGVSSVARRGGQVGRNCMNYTREGEIRRFAHVAIQLPMSEGKTMQPVRTEDLCCALCVWFPSPSPNLKGNLQSERPDRKCTLEHPPAKAEL